MVHIESDENCEDDSASKVNQVQILLFTCGMGGGEHIFRSVISYWSVAHG